MVPFYGLRWGYYTSWNEQSETLKSLPHKQQAMRCEEGSLSFFVGTKN
jgi:hypothetical protein